MITKDEFSNYVNQGFSMIPIVKKLSIKNETPLTIYSRLNGIKNTFLLESVEGGEKWAQYSIIGLDCIETIKVSGKKVESISNGITNSFISDDPLNSIRKLTKNYKAPYIKDLPRFFGGYVGFFAYESAGYAEAKIGDLPAKSSKFKDHMPEIYLVKAEKLIVFDNIEKSIQIIFNTEPKDNCYEDALDQISKIENIFNSMPKDQNIGFKKPKGEINFNSNFKKRYLNAVNTVKDYIKEAMFSGCLAQTFHYHSILIPFMLYKALRGIKSHLPYMYFLNLDECQVVGASPEILVRLEDAELTLRPIAGTRRRGIDDVEDRKNELDLLSDPKELAEHLMLIDLGRNDVGRVSKLGSVRVTDKMIIEKYSHVMHIVSNVVGEISDKFDYIDAMKSALPAGTLSGAPKIRAMEIINEIEPSSRGIYGGAIGYISWNGNIDTAIAIRTAVIKDDVIHVGAGAGIVADSIPENEWNECKQKAKVFLDALEMIE